MRSERNSKEDFIKGVLERINDGRWGLEEVEYLTENHPKYHLNYEDIGVFLMNVYQFTYSLALEDGVVNKLENDQLSHIQELSLTQIPKNRIERESLKAHILTLAKNFEKSNSYQAKKKMKLAPAPAVAVAVKENKKELKNENEFELENEPATMKEKINRVYYKTPRMKLTPYTYY